MALCGGLSWASDHVSVSVQFRGRVVDARPPSALLDGQGDSGSPCEAWMFAGGSTDEGAQRYLGVGALGVQGLMGGLVGLKGRSGGSQSWRGRDTRPPAGSRAAGRQAGPGSRA